MIKGSFYWEYKWIINIYVLNIGTPKYIKQVLTEEKEERQQYNNNRGL